MMSLLYKTGTIKIEISILIHGFKHAQKNLLPVQNGTKVLSHPMFFDINTGELVSKATLNETAEVSQIGTVLR